MNTTRTLVIDDEQIVLDSVTRILTEEQIGPLSREQRRWLDLRRSAEIW